MDISQRKSNLRHKVRLLNIIFLQILISGPIHEHFHIFENTRAHLRIYFLVLVLEIALLQVLDRLNVAEFDVVFRVDLIVADAFIQLFFYPTMVGCFRAYDIR